MDPSKAVGSAFIQSAEQLVSATNSPKYYAKNVFKKIKLLKELK